MPSFNDTALRFCTLIEHPPERVSLRLLQRALLELYAAALDLTARRPTPPLRGARSDVDRKMSPRWEKLLRPHHYFEVFDATVDTGAISGWLYDDVLDIHRDLRRALAHGDARMMFRYHWGAHCADALRALHWKLIGMSL